MTDQEINIKIAELCGYRKATDRDRTRGKYEWVAVNPIGLEIGWSEDCEYHHCIPNYAADLNACHEFEETLDALTEWHGEEHHANAEEAYMGALSQVCKGQNQWSDDWQVIHATARQRCEAFLRVHGRWEEAE